MTVEHEDWDSLSADWRRQHPEQPVTGTEAIERLRRRVHRHNRNQWMALAGEIALTLYFLVQAWSALAEPGGRGIVPAVATIAMIALVWTFAISNRRGIWRPLGETTSEYLRLSHARAQAGRRSIRFVRRVMVAALVCYVPWFALRLRDGAVSGTEWWRWAFLGGYTAGFLWWCAWRSRRVDAELALLRDVERELEEEGR
jgi:hypothetical protein